MQTDETAALVKRMQAGDASAFEDLYAAYGKTAVRTAALISGDPSLAEDIAQEAFTLCLLNITKLNNAQAFRSWFYRILIRCAWKLCSTRKRTAKWNEAAAERLPSEPDAYPSDHAAQYEPLYRALDSLGHRQRTAVILYYFNELSIREIARATASPEATVRTRLFAARRRLRQMLEREEETL